MVKLTVLEMRKNMLVHYLVGPVLKNPVLPAALLRLGRFEFVVGVVEGLLAVEESVDGGSLVRRGGGEEFVEFDAPLDQIPSIQIDGERWDR